MSNASDRAAARTNLAALANLGAKIVAYLGEKGTVETVGYIDQVADYAGVDGQSVETQNVVSLLTEDVPAPRRGDRVTDEDGTVWTLLNLIPGPDPNVTDWTVERK